MNGFCTTSTRVGIATAIVAATVTSLAPAYAGEDEQTVVIRPRTSIARGMANAVVVDDDDHVVQLSVHDGEISVTVDGEAVAQDRIRSEDGRIVILDKDGNPMKSLDAFVNPGEHFVFAMPGGDEDFQFEGARPDVVIGVHLTDPGAALRKHLKLDPDEGTMIAGLFEGLPAAKAGLQQYDIIVSVDGEPVHDPGSIVEALKGLKAGDEVTLGVIQAGRHKDFAVTVEGFDPARMDPSHLIGAVGGAGIRIPNLEFQFEPGQEFQWRDFLVDPGSKNIFRWRSEDSRSDRQFGDEENVDERLDRLNKRMEELRELMDQLVEEAKQRGG